MENHSIQDFSKVLKVKGIYSRKPSIGWICFVKIKINGSLPDEIQSEYLKKDAPEITIGNADWPMDKFIESCLETMQLYEESEFSINSPIEVKLIIRLTKTIEKNYFFEWPDDEKFELSKSYKSDGILLYRDQKIDQAFYKFSKSLKMLLLMECDLKNGECHPDGTELLISLYNNLANCQYHYKNYTYVIQLSSRSISVRPNVKGYFRRAMAYIELREYENAENDLLELLKIEPKNKVAIDKYKLVRELDKDNRENYENIVRNMFK